MKLFKIALTDKKESSRRWVTSMLVLAVSDYEAKQLARDHWKGGQQWLASSITCEQMSLEEARVLAVFAGDLA